MHRLTVCLAAVLALITSSERLAAQVRTVALSGDVADSGGGPAMTFDDLGAATINNAGEVAFSGFAIEAGQPRRGGVWSEGGGVELDLLALNGNPAPGVANATYADLELSYPSINDAGQTAYRARYPVVTGITVSTNAGAGAARGGRCPGERECDLLRSQ